MRKAWLLIFGSVLLAIGAGFSIFGQSESVDKLLEELSTNISMDLNQSIREMKLAAPGQYSNWLEEGTFPQQDKYDWIWLVIDEGKKLKGWSESEDIPPGMEGKDLAEIPDATILAAGNKVYYVLNQEMGSKRWISLLPLFVNYKVKNSYLPSRAFLGRYQHRERINLQLKGILRSAIPGKENVFEVKGPEVSYFIELEDTAALAKRSGNLIALCVYLGFGFFWFGLYFFLSDKWGPGKSGSLALAGAVLSRGVMLYSGFPGDLVNSKLFSASLLAINDWNPSLGDLSLNAILVFAGALLFGRFLFRFSPSWIKKLNSMPAAGVVVHLLLTSLSTYILLGFFMLFDSMVRNSRIILDLTDIFRINGYTLLFLGGITLMLSSVMIIIFQLMRPGFQLSRRNVNMRYWLIPGSILGAGILAFVSEDQNGGIVTAIIITFTAIFLLHLQVKRWSLARLDFLNYMIIALTLTFITAVALFQGAETRRRMEMETVASRVSEERDLVVESMFSRTLSDLVDESLVLQFGLYPDSILGDLSSWLKGQFFEEAFKGYDLNLFIMDDVGSTINPDFSRLPRIVIDSDSGIVNIGEETLSPNLRLVRDTETPFDFYYLGWFDLVIGKVGKLYVQVELVPNSFEINRIYPQLVLDDVVRDRLVFPKFIEFATYKSGKLIRKEGQGAVPLKRDMPKGLAEKAILMEDDGETETLFYRPSEESLVVVKSVKTDYFHSLNTFSFIFYYYIILFLLIQIPFLLIRLFNRKGEKRKMSFRAKVQIFLLAISVLPLVAVIFFLPPFTRDRFSKEVKSDLMEETARVANLLEEDFLLMTAPGPFDAALYRSFRERLEQLEQDIFNDINIYDADGKIRFTTRQAIYEMGLTSGMMNPDVYRQISNGSISEMVTEEQIGQLNYFSAYYPFYSDEREIVGYMNIPYLSQKDEILEEYLGLIAYIVDIYVLIFLAVGLIGFFLTDAILRPLTLLRRKLEEIRLGNLNEPIQWDSQDEIGEIIGAYNRMVKDLAISEKKLSQTQKEEAWQQMARQVAHEIKNPLTPMRLSIQHLIRSWKAGDAKIQDKFEKVSKTLLTQIDSLVTISNSFSEFAKMPEPQKSVFDLNGVLEDIVHLYENDELVQVEMHLTDKPFIVNSDRDQLSRVFNNLVKNGIQAIEHDHGLVTVKMQVEGRKATISIQDNGKGIPDELVDKIFQPNFSTKTSGMGLGLAIVKRIIENAGGDIYFDSQEGEGTIFYVELFESEQEIS